MLHASGQRAPVINLSEDDLLLIEYVLVYHISLPQVDPVHEQWLRKMIQKIRILRRWHEVEKLFTKPEGKRPTQFREVVREFSVASKELLSMKRCPICKVDHVSDLRQQVIEYRRKKRIERMLSEDEE